MNVSLATAPAPVAASPVPARVAAPPTPLAATAPRKPGVRLGRAIPRKSAPARDDSLAQLCVDEINRYRASIGRAPIQRAREKEACADGQAKADADVQRAHATFGRCGESAQNECPAWGGPADRMIEGCLKTMWDEGPGGGHYENMAGDARQVWCGFFTNEEGEIWSVQDFR